VDDRSGGGTTDLVKYIFEALLGEGRALYVFDCAEFACKTLSGLKGDGTLLLAGELLDDGCIVSEIDLCADDETGDTGAVVVDLGEPLLLDVLKRCGRCNAETDQEHICLRIAQRAQAVIIFLSSRIEQPKRVWVVTNHHRHCIVVEHSRNILAREFVRRVRDK
jgi:hypothetical protein